MTDSSRQVVIRAMRIPPERSESPVERTFRQERRLGDGLSLLQSRSCEQNRPIAGLLFAVVGALLELLLRLAEAAKAFGRFLSRRNSTRVPLHQYGKCLERVLKLHAASDLGGRSSR